MNYSGIKKLDVANGYGVRVSLFVSGCRNHCKGCFNPETWDFGYGQPFTRETEDELLEALAPTFIQGLSLLGGEPMEPENQEVLLPFVQRVCEAYPEKDIWLFTGYRWEDICRAKILRYVDVLVDGPFVQELKDMRLAFRGSANQTIVKFTHPRRPKPPLGREILCQKWS